MTEYTDMLFAVKKLSEHSIFHFISEKRLFYKGSLLTTIRHKRSRNLILKNRIDNGAVWIFIDILLPWMWYSQAMSKLMC